MSKEIERKWALRGLPSLELLERGVLDQGYISIGDPEVRLRKRRVTERWDHGQLVNSILCDRETCFLTVKQGTGISRDEYEVEVNGGQYRQLHPSVRYALEKYDWVYQIPGTDYQLVVAVVSKSDDPLDSVTVAEIEFPSVEAANAFDPKGVFDDVIIAEVTHIKDWKNANLASREGKLKELVEALNNDKSII